MEQQIHVSDSQGEALMHPLKLSGIPVARAVATVLAAEVVAEDLASGRLRQVLPEWAATSVPVYAMTEARLLPAKTQRFIEFLRERLST